MFIGPVIAVPMMLLSVYGIGSGQENIPTIVRFFMSSSFLRHALEGIIQSIYGFDRSDMVCPPEIFYCPYKKPLFLLKIMGFQDMDFKVSVAALVGFYLIFNIVALYLIKKRLSIRTSSLPWPIQYVSSVVKTYFNLTPYKV